MWNEEAWELFITILIAAGFITGFAVASVALALFWYWAL